MARHHPQQPSEPLDEQRLTDALTRDSRAALGRLEIFQHLDSTNAYLLGQPPPLEGYFSLALAEFQTAGRGRRGRAWSMPFGAGLMLSMGWHFSKPPERLGALTLAIGVAARQALLLLGVADVELKWPNDLVWQDGKLGGILVEVSSHGDGSCHVVVGIGVNVCLDDSARAGILSSWGRGPVDVSQATGGPPPSRNQLAAVLVDELHPLLRSYPAVGFEPYRTRWIESDMLAGQWVTVTTPTGQAVGKAAGVDGDGALLLQTAAGSERFMAGEVRLRDAR